MNGFCPRCGAEAETIEIQKGKYKGDTGSMRTTRCHGCGCRVSWYGDGKVRVWYNGGRMTDVPDGLLLVNAGKRL